MNIKILFWTLDIQLKLLTLHPEQSVCGVWNLLVGPVWRHIAVHGGSCVQRYHCSGYLSGIIFTPVLQENAQMLLNCIYPQQLLHDIWAGLNGQFRILYREPSIYTFLQKIKKELTFGHSIQSSNCVFFRGNRVLQQPCSRPLKHHLHLQFVQCSKRSSTEDELMRKEAAL